jgi:hypothetical protein
MLSVFSHATEDLSKVKKAILSLVPSSLKDIVKFEELRTKGHYNNEIVVITVKFRKKQAQEILKHIICSLRDIDKKIMLATLDNRVDNRVSHFHLRLSKQDAYLGDIRLLDGDDIIKLSVTINGVIKLEDLRKYLNRLIEEC